MSGDLREDLAAAFAEGTANNEPAIEVEAPTPKPVAEGRNRDEVGRFAPAVAAKDSLPADKEPQPQAAPAPALTLPPAPPTADRPPVGWKPEEAAGWETMAPHHKAAIMRRERDIDQTLYRTAQERKFANEVMQVMQPHMQLIQAEGGTPVLAIKSVMETAALLRTAPPQTKAQAVAQMIKQFNVPVEDLDAALSSIMQGRQPAVDPMQQVMAQVRQELAPLQQMLQMQQQATLQQAEQSVEQFLGDPQNEFAREVAPLMGQLLEAAAAAGQVLSLQDAYTRATLVHPDVSRKIMERKQQELAAQRQAVAAKARSAAVSVSDSGAPVAAGDMDESGDDIRSALGASIRQLSGRR